MIPAIRFTAVRTGPFPAGRRLLCHFRRCAGRRRQTSACASGRPAWANRSWNRRDLRRLRAQRTGSPMNLSFAHRSSRGCYGIILSSVTTNIRCGSAPQPMVWAAPGPSTRRFPRTGRSPSMRQRRGCRTGIRTASCIRSSPTASIAAIRRRRCRSCRSRPCIIRTGATGRFMPKIRKPATLPPTIFLAARWTASLTS